ncbi:MAG: hypothetical protein KGJ23_12575 [Euryarchaeota archaeon]|nr:hypothetical protein [Euryarchaeota archaeon]MDE1837433.1 hypothetical protein [Euryarchaeota archaeon]MDE1882165.1 hypothetical protein [Euryarchaeota archaeon]MDE2045601.1 hypothetical protein [Thermoplasmata archaeon]
MMKHVPWASSLGLAVLLLLGGTLQPASATHLVRPSSVSNPTGVWINMTRGWHPQTSEYNNMAYDTGDHEAVLFSGYSYAGGGGDIGDTWTCSAGNWTDLNLSSSASPPPTESYGFTYDAADGYALLFGGVGSGCPSVCSYSWTFSGGAWNQLHPSSSPPARWEAGMTYDPADGYVVLFGGIGCHNPSCSFPRNPLGDTWTFKAGAWTNITASAGTAPSPRLAPSLVYDSTDGYVVLNGGVLCALCSNHANDTWEFKAGHWTEISSSGGPPPNSFLGDDPKDGYVVAYGGVAATGCASTTTWAFNGGTWTTVSANTPGYVEGSHMVWDVTNGYALMFGGFGSNNPCEGYFQTNTWKYVGTGSSSSGPGGGSCSGCLSILGFSLPLLYVALLVAAVAVVVAVAAVLRRRRRSKAPAAPSYPSTHAAPAYGAPPPAYGQAPPAYAQGQPEYVSQPGPPSGYRPPPR